MGNTAAAPSVESAGHSGASLRKRHCVMQRKLLEAELKSLMGEARGGTSMTRSRQMLLAKIRQVKGQIEQLERVEMSFDRIANIKQTTTMVQQVKDLLDSTGGLPTVDGILDLEDSIAENQETLGELEIALGKPCQGQDISQDTLEAELDSLFNGGGGGGPGGGHSSDVLLLPSVSTTLPSERNQTPGKKEAPKQEKKSLSSPQQTSAVPE